MTKSRKEIEEILDQSEEEPKYERTLWYHEMSDSYVEAQTDLEAEACAENWCDEVTGIEKHEEAFKAQEAAKEKDEEILLN